MRQVWKFPLTVTDRQSVAMPRNARILRVVVQRDTPTLWAEVDPSEPPVERIIRIFGTGHPLPARCIYQGTAAIGRFVWHVYEEAAE
jgi:hypothetical protein